MKMLSNFRLPTFAAIALLNTFAVADDHGLRLSDIYSDHMVLQRETPLKISGTSKPGDLVKVTLNGSAGEGKADASGAWQAQLSAQPAGGPYNMTVSSSEETTSVQDVLIGDVWVCSGQSNMDFGLDRSLAPDKAINESVNSKLRVFRVLRNKSIRPLNEMDPVVQWKVSSPDAVRDFSAVGYYFGRELERELNVPIGLIQSAWGGTKVEWWTPLAGLKEIDIVQPMLYDIIAGKSDEQLSKQYQQQLGEWATKVRNADPGNANDNAWSATGFDDSAWETTTVPGNKKKGYFEKNDGTAWYRRAFTVSEMEASQEMNLRINCVDDVAAAYLNGKSLVTSAAPLKPHTFKIPEGTLAPGENTLAVQVIDLGGAGGICGGPQSIKLVSANADQSLASIILAGEWKFHPGTELKNLPERPTEPPAIRPTTLYNAMIAPLQKFPIRGVIWYQGESNATNDAAPFYGRNFSSMIKEWRKGWGVGDFPFLYVQLAGFRKMSSQPEESAWAELREQQEQVLNEVKNTAMASAIDIGEQDDIHPLNKMDVGKRLALGALAIAYGKPVEYMGPIYKSHKIEDNKVTISFTHADSLNTRNGQTLTGFTISGPDGKFIWADAQIAGNTVVVSSNTVQEPKAVRYGWANFSSGNLYNEADLPASPFRTDKSAK